MSEQRGWFLTATYENQVSVRNRSGVAAFGIQTLVPF